MNLPWRIGYTEREDDIIISTVEAPCLAWYGKYETAISVDNKPWRIYKGYENKEEALKWHEKFSKMHKEEILNLSSLD